MFSKAAGAASALPVTAAEFHGLLGPYLQRWSDLGLKRIALAVSGGGDSMALAYLFHQIVQERRVPDLEVSALIIDHGARKESKDEAHKVAGWMKEFGFKPSVHTLRWPRGTNPSSLEGFETLARRLRYQTLGQACLSKRSYPLFLGHHADDNVETALVRIAAHHRRSGLTGFDEVAPIPECDEMFGVSRSGRTMTFRSIYEWACKGGGKLATNPNAATGLPLLGDQQLHISTGGVMLYRPFRTIPKARLLATCEEAAIPYVTDMTNMDPTLTARNAARKLLASPSDLPEALGPESIDTLVQNCRNAELEEHRYSDIFLQHCKIVTFDLRSGSLVVQFPSPQELNSITADQKSIGDDVNVQARVLQRLNDLVCPSHDRPAKHSARSTAASVIFPQPDQRTQGLHSDNFTLGNVMWSPVRTAERRGNATSTPAAFTERRHASIVTDPDSSQPNLWSLSRRVAPRSDTAPVTRFQLDLPAFHAGDRLVSTNWSDWKLWDGRYWVRVRAVRSRPVTGTEVFPAASLNVTMRFLEEDDLTAIQNYMKHTRRSILIPQAKEARARANIGPRGPWENLDYFKFKIALTQIAKGKMKPTLPVLAVSNANPRPGNEEKGSVYGFPSIHARLEKSIRVYHSAPDQGAQAQRERISQWQLKWNVMYREIDPEVLRLTGYYPSQPRTERA